MKEIIAIIDFYFLQQPKIDNEKRNQEIAEYSCEKLCLV